jgi:hypothetical protein
MIEKSEDMRSQIQMTCPENLVPADRLLRKIDNAQTVKKGGDQAVFFVLYLGII